MKKRGYIIGAAALTATLAGCSSTYFASAGYGTDDLYAVHDKTAIARRKQAEAEAEKAEAEARKAEWEARIAQAEADAAQQRYYASNSSSNRYEEIVADTYQSAYARRLKGFRSPTYRMPSSYYNFRYGSSFSYVSAYDPAFYNVIVMGDEVWVEPKYITAMFGSWGRPSVYVDPWYYGWNYRPYCNWGFSFGSWGWSFGTCYDPWYRPGWGLGWGYGWQYGYPGHSHWGPGPVRPPHRPYASNIVHRADPYTSPSGYRYDRGNRQSGGFGSNNGGTYRDRIDRGGDFGVRNSPSNDRRQQTGNTPSSSRNNNNDRGSGSRDRGNSGSNNYNRGSSSNNGSYNRGSSSGNSAGSWGGSSSGGSYSRGGSSGSRSGGSGGGSRNAGGR